MWARTDITVCVSVDPNNIPAQICATAAGCFAGGDGHGHAAPCRRAPQYIPVRQRGPNPYLGAGFFWYTEGNSSYNALQIDVTTASAAACNSAPTTPGRRIST